MNSHKNARLTAFSRAEMVRRVLFGGWTAARAAQSYSISVRTIHKWVRRYREEGLAGLENRSSRPHSFGTAYIAGWQGVICSLRHCRMTAAEIAGKLGQPRSTVASLLRRIGLGRLAALDPKLPVRRYERAKPGDMIHLDIKKLARFDRPGHRVTGDRRRNTVGAGCDYVHVCVDDFSRVAYVEILADEKGETCAQFLIRAVLWMARRGIIVRRVMTDNGVGYVSHVFREALEGLGLLHKRTKPYTPQTNGKAERFIKTMLAEWAYIYRYKSSGHRNRALSHWLKTYNQDRPHSAIGGAVPFSRLLAAA